MVLRMEIIKWIGGLISFGLIILNAQVMYINYRRRLELAERIRADCPRCRKQSYSSKDCIDCHDWHWYDNGP
jgi:hypothetical protein